MLLRVLVPKLLTHTAAAAGLTTPAIAAIAAIIVLLLPVGAVRADGLPPLLSDWGSPGLLQTPTARMRAPGTVAAGAGATAGRLSQYYAGMQPLPWLWITARNTADLYPGTNPYGLTEPGLDLAIRVVEEGPTTPAVVIGGRDVTGSGFPFPGAGRFAGEYVVASRRWWSLDLSAGVGWGRLGGGLTLPNPVALRDRYRPLSGEAARGPRNWFSGRWVGLIAGAVWHTPVDGLSLLAELSPDTLKAERKDDPTLSRPFPVNVGVDWRPAFLGSAASIGGGIEQGDRFMLRLVLHPRPEQLNSDRPDPPPPVPRPRPAIADRLEGLLPPGLSADSLPLFAGDAPDNAGENAADPAGRVARDFVATARKAGLPVRALTHDDYGDVAWLDGDPAGPAPPARTIGRTARLMAATLPPDRSPWLTVVSRPAGLDGVTVSLPREAFLKAADGRSSPDELWPVAITPGNQRPNYQTPGNQEPPPEHGSGQQWWRSGFQARLRFVGEESLFENGVSSAGRGYTDAVATLSPWPGITLGASLRTRAADTTYLLNNWVLPGTRPVRSDLPLYAERPVSFPTLYLGLRHSLTPEWHFGADAGWLEEMYKGFGGEALYWPQRSRIAAGVTLYQVWKRASQTPLGRNRDLPPTTTGAGTVYWQGPDGAWTASLSAGRYLGGDWGGTLNLSRILDGNVTLSSHATWTTGPRYPEQAIIGGRLEYGLKLTAPLGEMAQWFSRSAARWLNTRIPAVVETSVRTLGRDAGQSLERPQPLYDSLAANGFARTAGSWSRLLE